MQIHDVNIIKILCRGKKNNKEELFLIPFRFACTLYFDVPLKLDLKAKCILN